MEVSEERSEAEPIQTFSSLAYVSEDAQGLNLRLF